MDIPKKARLTLEGREGEARALADGGLSEASALRRFNTAPWGTMDHRLRDHALPHMAWMVYLSAFPGPTAARPNGCCLSGWSAASPRHGQMPGQPAVNWPGA